MDDSPFHAGEQAMQARAGVRERLEAIGRLAVRDHMPEQHRELFGRLPTLVLAVQDAAGQPWATMLQGPPGFVSSPDAATLRVATRPGDGDPTAASLREDAPLGLLGIEPHTRRRNRANGRIAAVRPDGFDVRVLQSFGNCPKYIHARRPVAARAPGTTPAKRLGVGLDAAALALLARADTVFIASASAARPGAARGDGVDVSHRGGRPGFVAARGGAGGLRLTLPDYMGNFFFDTLGNLLAWPLAGLLVPDFDDGTLLHVAARASIEFDGPDLAAFAGAQRLLHLDVVSGWWRPATLPLRWPAPEAAPQFAASWRDTVARPFRGVR
jgi:predicted pyridoxine 5'-phosphate oxidase superfamily flavin-nucleotide-binding protein